jgi:hypothetical protein
VASAIEVIGAAVFHFNEKRFLRRPV